MCLKFPNADANIAAGFRAVLVSVDIPVLGIRPNEQRNKFNVPPGITMPMLADENGVMPADADHLTLDPRITWEESIKWLRQHTKMEVWLKGSEFKKSHLHITLSLTMIFAVTSAEDVALAIEHGVDGVLISNHGGRQL